MKTILTLILLMVVLTGCESTKYAVGQVFSESNDSTTMLKEEQMPPGSDSMLASVDNWMKKHLW